MASSTLETLYAKHRGKVSDKWSIYLSIYERLFAGLRDQPVRILEIGIQNGGSLEIWSEFFPQAKRIVGCDINELCGQLVYADPRIGVIVGDANTPDVEQAVVAHSPRFDLVIDDGSHRSGDIIRSFARYFPRLEDGGLYVVEDLHCAYWAEFEGGLFDPASSMAFFKRLADIVNHEHWGVLEARSGPLAPFATAYNVAFDEAVLGHVHAVEFFNSVCVIRKKGPADNRLGTRVIAGQDAAVDAAPLALQGATPAWPDQSKNPWSRPRSSPEQELTTLGALVRNLEGNLAVRTEELREARKAVLHADIRSNAVRNHAGQLKAKLNERAREAQQLQEALQDLRAHTAGLEEVLSQRQAQVEEMFRSTSWRVTKPLRWAGLQKARITRAAKLLPVLSQRAGGWSKLTRRGVQVLSQSGLDGLRNSIRTIETEELESKAASLSGDRASQDDPFVEIAHQMYVDQQSELSRREIADAIRDSKRRR